MSMSPTAQEAREALSKMPFPLHPNTITVRDYIDHAERREELLKSLSAQAKVVAEILQEWLDRDDCECEMGHYCGRPDRIKELSDLNRLILDADNICKTDSDKAVIDKIVALKSEHGVDISNIYQEAAKPATDEWEYYRHDGLDYLHRVGPNGDAAFYCTEDEEWIDCAEMHDEILDPANGWKRVEGGDS